MIRNFKIKYKIILIIIPFIVSLLISIYYFLLLGNKEIRFTNDEKKGIVVLNIATNILSDLSGLNILLNNAEIGISEGNQKINDQASKIDDEFKSLNDLSLETINDLSLGEKSLAKNLKQDLAIAKITNNWNLVKNTTDKGLAAFAPNYSALKAQVLDFISYVGDKSSLILDPELDTYYLSDSVLAEIPSSMDRIDNIYSNYIANIAKNNIGAINKASISIDAYMLIQNDLSKIENDLTTCLRENSNIHGVSPSLIPNTSKNFNIFKEDIQNLVDYLNNIVAGKDVTLSDFQEKLLATKNSIKTLFDKELVELDVLFDRRKNDLNGFSILSITYVMISLIISIIVFVFILRSLTKPISELIIILQEIAQGSLDNGRSVKLHNDEIGEMYQSLQDTTENLKEVIDKIINTTKAINLTSSNLNSIGNELSSTSEEQKLSITQTSQFVKQVNEIVKINYSKLQEVTELSLSTQETALSGNKVLANAILEVEKIEESSHKIANIISIIDEIAFQTNLLALNAAVESARAGEAGKGFAVVATEVRALAGRSSNASKEIKNLVQSSISQIKTGSNMVNDAGKSLLNVVESSKSLSSLILATQNLIKEQTDKINEINQLVQNIEKVSNSSSATNEIYQHVSSLNKEIKILDNILSFFKN
jgi:methyl-accepting chemotaxis protein